MRAALLQHNPRYLDVIANLATVERLLADVDADLIVLPELFATGYFFKTSDDLQRVAESIPGGESVGRMLEWSRLTGAVIVAGLPERDGKAIYNSAVVVSPDGIVGTYRKVHLFYKEKTLFAAGDLGFPVFDVKTRAGVPYRLGVMVCFDWYFPESARSLALKGADVIAHPSNLVRKDCPRAMPIRALENHVFTITANRYGSESSDGEDLRFIGQSVVCSPEGDVLFSAGRGEDAVGVVSIDPLQARDRRITALNDLFEDRRPKTYDALADQARS